MNSSSTRRLRFTSPHSGFPFIFISRWKAIQECKSLQEVHYQGQMDLGSSE